jgi:uncharacterized protein DUF3224
MMMQPRSNNPATTRPRTMTVQAVAFLMIFCLSAPLSASAQPAKDRHINHTRSSATPPARTHAAAEVTVRSSDVRPFDQTVSSALSEISINETFTGDIDAESSVRALQLRHSDGSASMVSLQRVRGTLGGRQGTFVLQGSGIIQNGKIKATWFVIPGSGTGDLSRLRGDGGFEGEFGKSSRSTLEYWFE